MLRVLCLGNELLADDAFGHIVAEELGRRFPQIDVIFSAAAGLHLLDHLVGADLVVIIDSVQTGNVPPGTLYVLRGSDMKSAPGSSLHYIGVFETLELARKLLLNVPEDVIILAVEAADCLTLGGEMHDAVKSAVGWVTDLVAEIAQTWDPAGTLQSEDSGDGLGKAIATVSARRGSDRLVVS